MKRLPIVIMMIVAGSFLAFQTMGTGRKNPPNKYEEILKLVGSMLTQAHFSPQDINDNFSKKIFSKYLVDLDPGKIRQVLPLFHHQFLLRIFFCSEVMSLCKNIFFSGSR